jgi:hypothetical protein
LALCTGILILVWFWVLKDGFNNIVVLVLVVLGDNAYLIELFTSK